LESICIPVSVEQISRESFSECVSLQTITFEPNSQLVQIDERAFCGCSSLKSLCIPASVQMIDATAFINTNITKIEVEEGNTHFSLDGDFLVDFARISLVRYFGVGSFVTIGVHFEWLCPYCFHGCKSIETIAFDPGSKLTRIGASPSSVAHHCNHFIFRHQWN
jgi:hypothetical protein